MSTIKIELPPALAEFVQSQVDAGLYNTPADVVEDAVRRASEEVWPDDLEAIRAAIAPGLADIEAGRTYELTLEEILAEARASGRAAE